MPISSIATAGGAALQTVSDFHAKVQNSSAALPLNFAAKLAVDIASVFAPFSRAVSVGTELRTAFAGVEGKLQHAFMQDGKISLPTYQTGASMARAFGQVCSPKSARAADMWSGCEAALGADMGSAVRSAVSLVPLPLPAKVGLFAASYGLDMLQKAHQANPDRVRSQLFATGSDFS